MVTMVRAISLAADWVGLLVASSGIAKCFLRPAILIALDSREARSSFSGLRVYLLKSNFVVEDTLQFP